jgi:large subunit ribosomal protein L13
MNSKTFVPSQDRQQQKWYLIDAEGKVLGRLASRIATMIRGKDNPLFTPHLDMGAYILSGKKWNTKKYYSYSGYPGGLKETPVLRLLERHPERIIEKAVKGMLPHNRLGRRLNKKLFVYAGENHPHRSQKPENIEI